MSLCRRTVPRPRLAIGPFGHNQCMKYAGCGVTEVVGTSDVSVEDAIRDGVARLGTVLEWFEVTGVRSTVLGSAERFQVDLRVGFRQAA